MPVKRLPSNPNLSHLKHQAKDLLKAHAARDPQVASESGNFTRGSIGRPTLQSLTLT